MLAPVFAASNCPKKYKFPPAWTPANMTANIAVYKSWTFIKLYLIKTAPNKNINAKLRDIKVWPTPNNIPERLPYFIEIFKASSN